MCQISDLNTDINDTDQQQETHSEIETTQLEITDFTGDTEQGYFSYCQCYLKILEIQLVRASKKWKQLIQILEESTPHLLEKVNHLGIFLLL